MSVKPLLTHSLLEIAHSCRPFKGFFGTLTLTYESFKRKSTMHCLPQSLDYNVIEAEWDPLDREYEKRQSTSKEEL